MSITLPRAVIEQALEAMEYADACLKRQLTTKTKHEYAQDLLLDSGTALRTALEQPEQEPVATVTSETGADISMSWWHEPALRVGTKLYTAPPQRKPLSDDEIQAIWAKTFEFGSSPNTFARAVEAAHNIKE